MYYLNNFIIIKLKCNALVRCEKRSIKMCKLFFQVDVLVIFFDSNEISVIKNTTKTVKL